MVGAGLLAKKAVEAGLASKPWVKTTLAPGSKVVTDYSSGPGSCPTSTSSASTWSATAAPPASATRARCPRRRRGRRGRPGRGAVLSGNRNFEGRVHPRCKPTTWPRRRWWSPTRWPARIDIDLHARAARRTDTDGSRCTCATSGPRRRRSPRSSSTSVKAEMFTRDYADVFDGDEHVEGNPGPGGDTFAWTATPPTSSEPPFFEDMPTSLPPVGDIHGRPGAGDAGRLASPPTTSPRPGRSRRTARPASTWWTTAWSRRTSTPTARAAATTR